MLVKINGPEKQIFRFIKTFFSVFARKQNEHDSFEILLEGPRRLKISIFQSSVGILIFTRIESAGIDVNFTRGMMSIFFFFFYFKVVPSAMSGALNVRRVSLAIIFPPIVAMFLTA